MVASRAAAGAPRRGRPPDPRKHRAIARAATRLFLERGFAGTSMDAVAAAAGVSKLTVYAHFGDKDALFQAIVSERCERYSRPESFDDLLALPPHDALRRIGRNFLALLLDPEVLRLHRVMVGEASRRPKMAELFFEAGPERLSALVADYLRRAAGAGQLALGDPRLAADQLHALFTGMPHFRASLNVGPKPTAREIERHVERSVELFLRAYGGRALAARAARGSRRGARERGR